MKQGNWIIYFLEFPYQFGDENVLTEDTSELRKSIENLTNQIKTHVVEIGLEDGKNWEHSQWILDQDKFQKDFGGYFGTISKNILLEVERIIDNQSETDTEDNTPQ